MRLGYIGYGEAAFEMSRGLKQAGLEQICAFDKMMHDAKFGSQISERACAAGITLCENAESVISQSDIVIAAVPANFTLSTSKEVLPYLNSGKLYVDVSAADPVTKRQIAEGVLSTGAQFADVAMMGVLPKFKHKVPILVCGNGAKTFWESMQPYGMDITYVGEEVGKASGIKLIRSLCLKGMAGLLMELLDAATTLDVVDDVIPGICKTMDECSFEQTMDRLVTGTAIHGARRAAELQGCVTMLDNMGLDSSITRAAIKKHEWAAGMGLRERFVENPPKTWRDTFSEIQKIKHEKDGKEE